MRNKISPEVRFWSKVDKNGPVVIQELGPCWNWTGALNAQGYGNFWLNGYQRASRVSWLFHTGSYPKLFMCHKCDNPACVNPYHLFEGDSKDNAHDMLNKGRHRYGVYLGPRFGAKGESNRHNKLTEEQVIEIIDKRSQGHKLVDLGNEYGVNFRTISAITTGVSWTHLNLVPRKVTIARLEAIVS